VVKAPRRSAVTAARALVLTPNRALPYAGTMNDNDDIRFEITGPDKDNLVWLSWQDGSTHHQVQLGPGQTVARKLSRWLAAYGGDRVRPA
jgi:hypothetical protein